MRFAKGGSGAYFDPILSLKFKKKYFLYKKNTKKINILDTRLLLGITHGKNFENMLRSMHFGVHIERILKIKWLFSYRNNDVSCTHARGHAPQRESFKKMCDLVRFGVYFDQILFSILVTY